MFFVGQTRFSLYMPNSTGWVVSRGEKYTDEEYRAYLFSDERLRARCDIFLNYSLPQLARAAEGHSVRHVVSYSSILPEPYKSQLREAAEQYPFLLLDEVPEGRGPRNINRLAREYLAELGADGEPFARYRLDDDDLLSADFFEQLAPYVTAAHVGYLATLARGFTALYLEGVFHFPREVILPLNAIGLAYICRWDAGTLHAPVSSPHMQADRHNPVILDSRAPSSLWVRSESQDTLMAKVGRSRQAAHDRLQWEMEKYAPATPADVLAAFPALQGRVVEGWPTLSSVL